MIEIKEGARDQRSLFALNLQWQPTDMSGVNIPIHEE